MGQGIFIHPLGRHITLGGTGLTHHKACPAFGDPKNGSQLNHGLAAPFRAQKFPFATSSNIALSKLNSATSFFSR